MGATWWNRPARRFELVVVDHEALGERVDALDLEHGGDRFRDSLLPVGLHDEAGRASRRAEARPPGGPATTRWWRPRPVRRHRARHRPSPFPPRAAGGGPDRRGRWRTTRRTTSRAERGTSPTRPNGRDGPAAGACSRMATVQSTAAPCTTSPAPPAVRAAASSRRPGWGSASRATPRGNRPLTAHPKPAR